MSTVHKTIGVLIFDQCTGLDVTGPLEAFATANALVEGDNKEPGPRPYQIQTIAPRMEKVTTETGLGLYPDTCMDMAGALDTLIIPGGAGGRHPDTVAAIRAWLLQRKDNTRRIVSVCTGAFLLAESGLLDGLAATTHWAFASEFGQRFPRVNWVPESLYINHGDIATSAGITAGIDLTLNLIEGDLGTDVATRVARYLVVHYRRSGDQTQFSEPLRFQTKADSKFSALTGWILNNLQRDLSIEAMANHSGMSERNFCRRFTQQMGVTPAAYVQTLRLDYARQLLSDKSWPIKRVAEASGYQHTDVFRRAFERRFSLSPKAYRERFTP